MAVEDEGKSPAFPEVKAAAADSRALVRTALKGALATVQKGSGHPYASLVLVATEPDGSPVLLISRLALHTKNLQSDSRATLLIDGTGDAGDPMTGARVTLIGNAQPTQSATARARFLARHPSAVGYADFADFGFYDLQPEHAHFIGGFGRIVDVDAANLLLSLEGAEPLVASEPDIVSHMNADHADALELYATNLLGGVGGAWRMTGIDPEGCDLVLGARALRLPFGPRVTSPAEARQEFVRLTKAARGNDINS
jgi:hypothetical protein